MTQAEALSILKIGKNVFVTGAAGSGKTYLINSYIAYLKSNNIVMGITASTGIAANHMGGVTIHSWAGMGIHSHMSAYEMEALLEKQYLFERFRKVKVLIIDEVSMLHHFRFDLVNRICQTMKGNDLPFGGIQVVLCGDFFQLPPVVRFGEPEAHFIYESDAWKEANFTICYLEEQFRQKDDALLNILNEIRAGNVSVGSKEIIKKRLRNDKESIKDGKKSKSSKNETPLKVREVTRLFTHNSDVDAINSRHLEDLETIEEETYEMEEKGKEFLVELLKKSCLAPETLHLKIGARVMCVKNNFDEGYVNGTLGIVSSCRPGADPKIRTLDGKVLTIEQASWKIEEDGKVVAEIKQYPLRHAWAITVHKSQGMSLDEIEVDLSKSFESGMGYVALSRVRTLDGLFVIGINDKAFDVREDVLVFDDQLKELSKKARTELGNIDQGELNKIQMDFVLQSQPKSKQWVIKKRGDNGGGNSDDSSEIELSTIEKTAALIEEGISLAEMAKRRQVTEETIISHIETLINDEVEIDIGYLKKEIAKSHFKKIHDAILEITTGGSDDMFNKDEEVVVTLAPVKHKVGANVSYLHIRLARAILGYVPKTIKK